MGDRGRDDHHLLGLAGSLTNNCSYNTIGDTGRPEGVRYPKEGAVMTNGDWCDPERGAQGETVVLRIGLADGEWDAFERADGGHAANEETEPCYLIHRRHGRRRGHQSLEGVATARAGGIWDGFSIDEQTLTSWAREDRRLPYAQAVELVTKYMRAEQAYTAEILGR